MLHAFPDKRSDPPDATLTTTALAFKRMIMGLTTATDLMADSALVVDGSLDALGTLGELFDRFERRFPIVTPRPVP